MAELADRLVILVVAATGLAVLIVGWAGGLVEAELAGWLENAVFLALGLLFLGALVGIWHEFNEID